MARRAQSKRKRPAVVVAVIALAIVAAGLFWILRPQERSLRRAIAGAFNRPVELIELNVPPAAGRYPGSILTETQPTQLVVYRAQARTGSTEGPATTVMATAEGSASASVLAETIGSTEASGSVNVDFEVTDLRVLEITVDKSLRDSLLSDTFLTQNAAVWRPRIVVRAYEGVITITLRQAGSVGAEAWQKAREKVRLKAGAKLQTDGSVKYSTGEPTVVAFETLDLQFFSKSAGAAPDDVRLIEHVTPVAPADLAAATRTSPSKLAFATVATTHRGTSRELRMAAGSVTLVSRALQNLGAEPLGVDVVDPTEELLTQLPARVAAAAKERGVDAVIVYYVGHTYNDANGVHYLELSSGDRAVTLHKQLIVPRPGGAADGAIKNTLGDVGGLEGILSAVNSVDDAGAQPHSGLFPLGVLARSLEEGAGAPFALIVDGCFEKSEIVALRSELGLTPHGDYFGPRASGGPEEVSALVDAFRAYSAAPYLRSTNVVILAAAPGTVAVDQVSPRGTWTGDVTVGPLAARLDRVAHLPPYASWGELLRALRDIGNTGELRTFGTVTWSDFSRFDALHL